MSKYYLIKDDSAGQDTTGIWVENPTGKWKVKQPIELTKEELEVLSASKINDKVLFETFAKIRKVL